MAHLFHPRLDFKKSNFLSKITKTTSIPTSTKPTKIKHFTTFTALKNIKTTFKIPSNPYKSSTFSNSTENTIFNNEITHQKPSIYISSIIQNTSKINTFQSYQIHKQHYSIEVIIFYHQIHIKLTSKIHTK